MSESPSPSPSPSDSPSPTPAPSPTCTLDGPALDACSAAYELQTAQDSHRTVLALVPGLALLILLGACILILNLAH